MRWLDNDCLHDPIERDEERQKVVSDLQLSHGVGSECSHDHDENTTNAAAHVEYGYQKAGSNSIKHDRNTGPACSSIQDTNYQIPPACCGQTANRSASSARFPLPQSAQRSRAVVFNPAKARGRQIPARGCPWGGWFLDQPPNLPSRNCWPFGVSLFEVSICLAKPQKQRCARLAKTAQTSLARGS